MALGESYTFGGVTFVTWFTSPNMLQDKTHDDGRLASAAIGPVADLTISNADITPDGFTRAAVVMNGQMPGPLITGNMVSLSDIFNGV